MPRQTDRATVRLATNNTSRIHTVGSVIVTAYAELLSAHRSADRSEYAGQIENSGDVGKCTMIVLESQDMAVGTRPYLHFRSSDQSGSRNVAADKTAYGSSRIIIGL